jgi:hypothetical protein
VLLFAVVVFVTWGGVAYADAGHGGGVVVEKPVEVEVKIPTSQGVLDLLNQVILTIARDIPPILEAGFNKLAEVFNSASSVSWTTFNTISASNLSSEGIATIAFQVETTTLLTAFNEGTATSFSASRVTLALWNAAGDDFTPYSYRAPTGPSAVRTMEDDDDKTFYFVDDDGKPVSDLVGAENIYPIFKVKDGDLGDTDGPGNETVTVNPSAVVTHNTGGTGGGGCDAGFSFAGAALLVLAGGCFLFGKRGA